MQSPAILLHFYIFLCLPFLCLSAREKYKNLSPSDIQQLATELWYLDSAREKLDLSFQTKLSRDEKQDKSPQKLIKNSQPQIFNKPSVQKMQAIFDMYKSFPSDQLSIDQNLLAQKSKDFLDTILQTKEFQILKKRLNDWDYPAAKSDDQFRNALYDMWFERYPRKKVGRLGSSGFQHVFVGEIDRQAEQVSGLHNWIRFEKLEQQGDIDYAGYLTPGNYIAAIRYRWKNNLKLMGSMFFGTSPEYDMAIFTMCFLTKPGQDRCQFLLYDCTEVRVTSMKFQGPNSKNQIATVYPEVGKVRDTCDVKPPPPTKEEGKDRKDDNSASNFSTTTKSSMFAALVAKVAQRFFDL